MPRLRVSEDIIPVSEFKAQASDWLRRVATSRHPLVITQNGKPAGVLLSPTMFDALTERQNLFAAVQEGMRDEEAGRLYSSEEVFAALEEKIAASKAE